MIQLNLQSVSFFVILLVSVIAAQQSLPVRVDKATCPGKLDNCTAMVTPHLRDLSYMFPTTIHDVDGMCKMWSNFVDCVRRYVSTCFNDERRSRFNLAVENSIDTVHAICSSDEVQREYLSNSECFKKVSVDNCGNFYLQLIDHVSNPRSHDDHICCAYSQFKRCVHEPLLRECGHRARNLMDHSMGFLISKCSEKAHLSLTEKCPTPPPAVPPPTSSAARSEDSQLNDNEIHGSQRSYDDHSVDSDTGATGHFGRNSFKDPETGSRTSSSSLLSPTSAFLIPFVLISTIFSFISLSHLQPKN